MRECRRVVPLEPPVFGQPEILPSSDPGQFPLRTTSPSRSWPEISEGTLGDFLVPVLIPHAPLPPFSRLDSQRVVLVSYQRKNRRSSARSKPLSFSLPAGRALPNPFFPSPIVFRAT